MYRETAAVLVANQAPIQAWIQLSGRDAGEDAIFMHSKNGNGTAFPADFSFVKWGVPPLEEHFKKLLPEFDVRAGESRFMDSYSEPEREISVFIVYCRGVGVSLEASS